ncbi:hypothetical protein THAOC_02974 [Thalassiosira oceanica]|uniref:Uncharacterized protein n=1 Tax=Thalassiosira oceanica TaxID=159749 RepID=K0TDU3_THAOC|nr:hypothetical protein THAOC_02974 [Thalassiosira oceanica]|eukprot:EJK75304.1 hypothetical protein THAOC_02974 [Thalassiosira oceanica]
MGDAANDCARKHNDGIASIANYRNVRITAAPTLSSAPTISSAPSQGPSITHSLVPSQSAAPSDAPSISTEPSGMPSEFPTYDFGDLSEFHTLETPRATDLRVHKGIMFDVTAKDYEITIRNFRIPFLRGGSMNITIWSKDGPFWYEKNNQDAWDYLGSPEAYSPGVTLTDPVPLQMRGGLVEGFEPIVISAGSIKGIYITVNETSADDNLIGQIRKMPGSTCPSDFTEFFEPSTWSENDDLSLSEGAYKDSWISSGHDEAVRYFGTIYYTRSETQRRRLQQSSDQGEIEGTFAAVPVTFDGLLYEVCPGTAVIVTWNGYHNIVEVTMENYNAASSSGASEVVGAYYSSPNQITLPSDTHAVSIAAAAGETRYFVCALHPTSGFRTTCTQDPSTHSPTGSPTRLTPIYAQTNPTGEHTSEPTSSPSESPTTASPSSAPSNAPTTASPPTSAPSSSPTTTSPTSGPTSSPSVSPSTAAPTSSPTQHTITEVVEVTVSTSLEVKNITVPAETDAFCALVNVLANAYLATLLENSVDVERVIITSVNGNNADVCYDAGSSRRLVIVRALQTESAAINADITTVFTETCTGSACDEASVGQDNNEVAATVVENITSSIEQSVSTTDGGSSQLVQAIQQQAADSGNEEVASSVENVAVVENAVTVDENSVVVEARILTSGPTTSPSSSPTTASPTTSHQTLTSSVAWQPIALDGIMFEVYAKEENIVIRDIGAIVFSSSLEFALDYVDLAIYVVPGDSVDQLSWSEAGTASVLGVSDSELISKITNGDYDPLFGDALGPIFVHQGETVGIYLTIKDPLRNHKIILLAGSSLLGNDFQDANLLVREGLRKQWNPCNNWGETSFDETLSPVPYRFIGDIIYTLEGTSEPSWRPSAEPSLSPSMSLLPTKSNTPSFPPSAKQFASLAPSISSVPSQTPSMSGAPTYDLVALITPENEFGENGNGADGIMFDIMGIKSVDMYSIELLQLFPPQRIGPGLTRAFYVAVTETYGEPWPLMSAMMPGTNYTGEFASDDHIVIFEGIKFYGISEHRPFGQPYMHEGPGGRSFNMRQGKLWYRQVDTLEPSESPSVSQVPSLSTFPSMNPSLSSYPSMEPSESSEPTVAGSTKPSTSILPSFHPSDQVPTSKKTDGLLSILDSPSTSAAPSSTPSESPSLQPSTTQKPSIAPSESLLPTQTRHVLSCIWDVPECWNNYSWGNMYKYDCLEYAAGVMFEVVAENDITIQTFQIQENVIGGVYGWTIFTKPGGWDGFQRNADAWTKLGEATVDTSGRPYTSCLRNPAACNVLFPSQHMAPVTMYPGETRSFYIASGIVTDQGYEAASIFNVSPTSSDESNGDLIVKSGFRMYPYTNHFYTPDYRLSQDRNFLFRGEVVYTREASAPSDAHRLRSNLPICPLSRKVQSRARPHLVREQTFSMTAWRQLTSCAYKELPSLSALPSSSSAKPSLKPSTSFVPSQTPSALPSSGPSVQPTDRPVDFTPEAPMIEISIPSSISLVGFGIPQTDAEVNVIISIVGPTLQQAASANLSPNQRIKEVIITSINGNPVNFRRGLAGAPRELNAGLGIEYEIILEEICATSSCDNAQEVANQLYQSVTESMKEEIDSGAFAQALETQAVEVGETLEIAVASSDFSAAVVELLGIVSRWYPAWGNTGDYCLNDGNEPGYMRLNPGQWIESSLSKCCKRYYDWIYSECMGTVVTVATGSSRWFVNHQSSTCVQDCPEGSSVDKSCGGLAQSWNKLHDTALECCSVDLGWIGEQFCVAQSTGVSTGTNLWFVDWIKEACAGSNCGGVVTSSATETFETADSCCENKLGWMEKDDCVAKSTGATPSQRGSFMYYVDWALMKCVKDCEDPSDPHCKGLAEKHDTLYASANTCCSEKLYWLDPAASCVP